MYQWLVFSASISDSRSGRSRDKERERERINAGVWFMATSPNSLSLSLARLLPRVRFWRKQPTKHDWKKPPAAAAAETAPKGAGHTSRKKSDMSKLASISQEEFKDVNSER